MDYPVETILCASVLPLTNPDVDALNTGSFVSVDVDGGNVTASFHSDGSVTKPGFFATYEVKPSESDFITHSSVSGPLDLN